MTADRSRTDKTEPNDCSSLNKTIATALTADRNRTDKTEPNDCSTRGSQPH